ncbi:MAG: two-component regulator propeller domain-containing protein [Immundisolibacter sp.]|uniref:ligand-binding sensor domain-containing protein n=1 Tax=Immundisolibacter sp. TaxID=1934948 RepID=UPI003D144745
MTLLHRLGLAALLCVVGGSAGAQRAWRVQDSYEVGPAVYVRALTVEASRGALWVGTSAGVHEVELAGGKLRSTFTRKEGLANEYVFAIGIDRQGHKWFGTNAGGASRYKDGQWKTFFPMHGLADYWIYSFAQQKNGDFWIGTWAGVNKVDGRTGRFSTYVKELVNEWVYGIAVDARDRVWFGTEGGVTLYDGKRWTSWTHKDGLGAPNSDQLPFSTNTGLGTRSRHDLTVGADGPGTYNPNYVFAILAARDGSVWAGTWGGGAARWDGRAWTNLTVADGLAGNIVYSIAQDDEGALWFGTNQGVSRWDGKAWQTFAVKDGLLERNVYALAVAPGGSVWAGTRKGVVRIAR